MGINRNIVECKSHYIIIYIIIYIELIETLWNVNHFKTFANSTAFFELIETLWNVNCLHLVDS